VQAYRVNSLGHTGKVCTPTRKGLYHLSITQ
jgi:hypothetical protein